MQSLPRDTPVTTPMPVAAVREQLQRLLAHPLFTNSRRYPVLLAYIVEQTLSGCGAEIKERTIGVEAFGREPSYDVSLDPIVRMTAAEVRKRLIQYYYNPLHAAELVIELPLGSYLPSFHLPAPIPDLAPEPAPEPPATAKPPRTSLPLLQVFALAVLLLVAGFGLGRIRLPQKPSSLERFWMPFTESSGRVSYCLGEPLESIDRSPRAGADSQLSGSLNVSDVTTLARSIVPLVPRNGSFRVLAARQTSFTQLREGPNVLIGAFDNPWTLRLTAQLPVGFSLDNGLRKIVDRRTGHFWTLESQLPDTQQSHDYALVARIHDQVTGEPVILLAGILGEGTEAASEVVSNPAAFDALLRKAPRNWDQLNLEAVVETQVIGGHSGPPTIVAVETW